LLAHDVPARLTRHRRRFLQVWEQDLIPRAARAGLAECFDVFCDRGYFSLDESRRLFAAAARAGLKLKLHAEQLAHTGAARLAAEFRAISADHLDRATGSDIARLSGAGTIATLLPGSTVHLGLSGYPPARRLIEGGVPVALATNFNPGSSPTPNMQVILSLACSQMRMTPAEALTAATINGAYALGQGTRLGSLEPGKQADLIVMNVADYRQIPYYFGVNHCMMVFKKGRLVHRQGMEETAGLPA
jgi:imidazolonepropionase